MEYENFLWLVITIALAVSAFAFILAMVGLNDVKALSKELKDEVSKLYAHIENLCQFKTEVNNGLLSINTTLETQQKDIDNLREGSEILNKSFNEHVNDCISSKEGNRSKVAETNTWNELFKKECQNFIVTHKNEMTYAQIAEELDVPLSTIKRWGKEVVK